MFSEASIDCTVVFMHMPLSGNDIVRQQSFGSPDNVYRNITKPYIYNEDSILLYISQIYYCPPEVVDTCCNAKPYCSWNHWFYPSYGHPPKTCSVKVKDSWETYDLCEYPNMIWKYKDFECKCPEVRFDCC